MSPRECDKGIFLWIAVCSCYCISVSCTSSRKAIYFQGLTDSVFQSTVVAPEVLIRSGDLLQISITNAHFDSSALKANASQAGIHQAGMVESITAPASEYLVDRDGMVVIPLMGHVKAAGLLRNQLQQNLAAQAKQRNIFPEPFVTVRLKNFNVTVLGEVGKPGTFNIPGEKVTIMQAIGLAGDVSLNARRDRVLLIREESGRKFSHRINLHSLDLFASSYYYLKPDDLIYIEPDKTKISSTSRARQALPLIASGLSLVVIVLDRFVW